MRSIIPGWNALDLTPEDVIVRSGLDITGTETIEVRYLLPGEGTK